MNKTNTQKRGDETENGEIAITVTEPISESSTETERLRTENETLKTAMKMRDAREQMTQSLVKAGAMSPDLLFDSAKASLQFNEEGKLLNGAAILEHLKKTLPEQFRTEKPQGSIDGGAGRGGAGYLTKESLAKMTSAEIGKLDWQEVRRVLGDR
ncbi:MAG: hypothetical protein WKF92_05260 [Pyrinomonadaceae bacterium]